MFAWMHWTVPSAIGIFGVFAMIVGLNVLDNYKPGFARKGFLPMATTRGDRVFVCIISTIIIWMLWLRFLPDASIAVSLLIAAPIVLIIMKWG